jgi:hypothetical protein
MPSHELPSGDVERVESPTSSTPAILAERWYPDWRKRLAGNLSRRSETHWDPLTYRDAVSRPLVDEPTAGGRS